MCLRRCGTFGLSNCLKTLPTNWTQSSVSGMTDWRKENSVYTLGHQSVLHYLLFLR